MLTAITIVAGIGVTSANPSNILKNHTKNIGCLINRYCKPDLSHNVKLDLCESTPILDPITNRVAASNAVVTKIKAWLNQVKPPTSELTNGSDRDRIYVEGYLVEPKQIDYDLGDQLSGTYLYERTWVDCLFYPVPLLADNFTTNNNLHANTGRKIAGYLKFEGIN